MKRLIFKKVDLRVVRVFRNASPKKLSFSENLDVSNKADGFYVLAGETGKLRVYVRFRAWCE